MQVCSNGTKWKAKWNVNVVVKEENHLLAKHPGRLHDWIRLGQCSVSSLFPVACTVTGGPTVGEQAGADITATGSHRL